MPTWFEGSREIGADLAHVQRSLADLGAFYTEVVGRMPGLSSVELVARDEDSVTIRTNEGRMTRSSLSTSIGTDRVAIEFDERYEAGSQVTTTAHFVEEFSAHGAGALHRLTIRDVTAPGFLGFSYRRFGSAKTGNAFLDATREYLEAN